MRYLKKYDVQVFEVPSRVEKIDNLRNLDIDIQSSNSLNDAEKQELRELNAILYHSIIYQGENDRRFWGCLSGILVTIGGGATANPLGVIAGAMIIDKYC